MDPGQLSLELEGMVEAMRQEDTQQVSYTRKKVGKEEKPGHGRMPIPAHLRREEIIIEPEEVPEGSKKIGEEVTEVMEPACRRQVQKGRDICKKIYPPQIRPSAGSRDRSREPSFTTHTQR